MQYAYTVIYLLTLDRDTHLHLVLDVECYREGDGRIIMMSHRGQFRNLPLFTLYTQLLLIKDLKVRPKR